MILNTDNPGRCKPPTGWRSGEQNRRESRAENSPRRQHPSSPHNHLHTFSWINLKMKDATNINPSRRESLARSFPLNPPHPSQSTSQNVFWNEFEDQMLANAKEARIAVSQSAKLDVKFWFAIQRKSSSPFYSTNSWQKYFWRQIEQMWWLITDERSEATDSRKCCRLDRFQINSTFGVQFIPQKCRW